MLLNRARRRAVLWTVLFSLSFSALSCAKKSPGPPPRYAFVRFENLSGASSLDWIGIAVAEYLSSSLSGAMDGPVLGSDSLTRSGIGLGFEPAGAPGASAQRADALSAGVNRLYSGFIEKIGNQIRLVASAEDLSTHQTTKVASASAPDAMTAIAKLAREIAPTAAPYFTSNEHVLRLYSASLVESAGGGVPLLEQALREDPNFGPAWVALANTALVRGDRAALLEAVQKGEGNKIDPLSRANLEVLRSRISGNRKTQVDALRKLSDQTPGDAWLLRQVAEAQTATGRFADSAQSWKKIAGILPNNPDALNQQGYTRAWSGDYAGAVDALKEYARVHPNDPNPLDSLGDVQFMYRKFGDAAVSYMSANSKDPRFLNAGEPYKAAWARYAAGDKSGADTAFGQFRAAREKSAPADLDLYVADWYFRTGRRPEAVKLLQNKASVPANATQLAVWDLMAKQRDAAVKRLASINGTPSVAVLFAKFAAMPSATAEVWKQRAETVLRGPGAEAIRDPALGYALLLDGKTDAAREVWTRIVQESPATDFFSRAVLAKLKGEPLRFALLPDPNSVNPMRVLVD
jgi:tetratricopeptide (TPR) repeat protein